MQQPTRAITILGAGKIGSAIAALLRQQGGYEVCIADQDPARLAAFRLSRFETCLIDSDTALQGAVAGRFAVLNALPFHCAVASARLCAEVGVHYFDLTEDVHSTHAIAQLATNSRAVLMPQCGLAPGFIGVVGNDLARRFDQLLDLRMRVGALPRFPSNALGYNLTWSTAGLINEYCNPCEAIVDGRRHEVNALEGLERFTLDGVEYEAFNTSGGLGTLTHTLLGQARNIDYKSIRYPGHCAVMKLLLNDLRLRDRRDLLQDIFDQAIPATEQDVIVIMVTASGYRNGRLIQDAYSARITGQEIDGETLSAIQLTTAAGICTALDLVTQGVLPQAGFVGQEQIGLQDFLGNRFGRFYAHGLGQHAALPHASALTC